MQHFSQIQGNAFLLVHPLTKCSANHTRRQGRVVGAELNGEEGKLRLGRNHLLLRRLSLDSLPSLG